MIPPKLNSDNNDSNTPSLAFGINRTYEENKVYAHLYFYGTYPEYLGVPDGSLDSYKALSGWNYFTTIEEIEF